jgi:hypothetical protein
MMVSGHLNTQQRPTQNAGRSVSPQLRLSAKRMPIAVAQAHWIVSGMSRDVVNRE